MTADYAQQSLPASNAMNNLGAMNPPNQGVPNAMDSGGGALPGVNFQPMQQMQMAQNNEIQNATSAMSQRAAGARDVATKMETEESDRDDRAQQMLANAMYTQMDAQGLGGNSMMLNQLMQSPERARMINSYNQMQNMLDPSAPELAAYESQNMQYRA